MTAETKITKTMYCSACDRDVLIQLNEAGTLEGATCADIGASCTGTMCPICAVAPDVLRKRVEPRPDLTDTL
jgi:hypothetical protein